MGALALDTYMLCPIDCVTLGLKSSTNGSQRKPHVLSLLSTFLDVSVRENERVLEDTQTKDVITIFHGLKAPSLSVQQYIDRIYKYSCCSPSCMVIAHVYIDRYMGRTNTYLTSFNIHRLLITSIMVAAKFMDDAFFNNAYYAKVGGVSTVELNKLEMKFLFDLDFRLHVNVQTFGKYCSLLKKQASGSGGLIERSIQACGAKDNWATNKDDSACQSTARREVLLVMD